jgi:hypothetical protein
MRVATDKVVGGKVVIDGDPFAEGAVVTVVAPEADETFVATPEQEAALLDAIAECERGETITSEELLERLRRTA